MSLFDKTSAERNRRSGLAEIPRYSAFDQRILTGTLWAEASKAAVKAHTESAAIRKAR